MSDRNRWRVYERIEADCIYVSMRTGGLIGRTKYTMGFGGRMDVGIYVYPPNIFERLVGITHKSKYLSAKRKMEMEADAHNRGMENGVRFKKEVKKWMD